MKLFQNLKNMLTAGDGGGDGAKENTPDVPKVDPGPEMTVEERITAIAEEAAQRRPDPTDPIDLTECETWTVLLNNDPAHQAAVGVGAFFFMRTPKEGWNNRQLEKAVGAIAQELLLRDLPFSTEDVISVVGRYVGTYKRDGKHFMFNKFPTESVITACETACRGGVTPEPLRAGLTTWIAREFDNEKRPKWKQMTEEETALLARMTALIEAADPNAAEQVNMDTSEAYQKVLEIVEEAIQNHPRFGDRIELSECSTWAALLKSDKDLQVAVAMKASFFEPPKEVWGGIKKGWHKKDKNFYKRSETLRLMALQLLQRKLPFTVDNLISIIHEKGFRHGMLKPCENLCGGKPLPEPLHAVVQAEFDKRFGDLEKQFRETDVDLYHGMRGLLGIQDAEEKPAETEQKSAAASDPSALNINRVIYPGPWGARFRAVVTAAADKDQQSWLALIKHLNTASKSAKPKKGWLETARPLVNAVGGAAVADPLAGWLTTYTPEREDYDVGLETLKGFIWLAPFLPLTTVLRPLGRFAEVCFSTTARGVRAAKLGNACLLALGSLEGDNRVATELVRLQDKIKNKTAQKQITATLNAWAEARGITRADLEELALATFGLSADGQRVDTLGDATATLTVDAARVTLGWMGADGKALKSPPAVVKRDYGEELKALKADVKTVDAARRTQIHRLEGSWLADRAWPYATWRERFIDHPLRCPLSETLIWQVGTGDVAVTGLWDGKGLVDVTGQPLAVADDATIRLWHPIDSTAEAVLAWRRRITALDITQPFKQAHREIYVLTDAERATDTYSNRFAAHILYRTQFNALCKARDWKYSFYDGWDGDDVTATLALPAQGMQVDYAVQDVVGDGYGDGGAPMHLRTDRVQFTDADGVAVVLDQVPPLVFSEVMRDVDLFVGVTSVANDPDWVDGGPEGPFGAYWHETAFGDLTQTAAIRRDLLQEIVPALSFADRAKITDKFLEIKGTRHTYQIHLGSGNIQILPDNRYLCIVRAATGRKGDAVKLPFAGDTMLSIILSKAFLLAADDKIKDPVILNQL